MPRAELKILPGGLSLVVVELGTEHIDETDLPVLGDRRVDGGHDDVLVVLLLHVIDRLEPKDARRHVTEESDHHRQSRPERPLRQTRPSRAPVTVTGDWPSPLHGRSI